MGSIIVVQPGEKVPLDGVVVEGEASLNTSALTGESLAARRPRRRRDHQRLHRPVRRSEDPHDKGVRRVTVSKILDLVENASSRKSRSEAFISRFAKIYTPVVCIAALALAVLMPLGRMAFGASPTGRTGSTARSAFSS